MSKTKPKAKPKAKTKPRSVPIWKTVRELAKALPGAEESTSYGTPAFKVHGKLFVRVHDREEALVVGVEMADRALRLKADPETCYLTDHYLNAPWILVRWTVSQSDLAELLEEAWRRVAPPDLIKSKSAQT